MARTHGHGNPDWTRDETILALALYFDCGESVPSRTDPRLIKLSAVLRSLPYHVEAARKETFRNPDGVGFKLQNLRSVATGKGLSNTSKTDREIWAAFGNQPSRVRELARVIEAAINLPELTPSVDVPVEEEFFEGRMLTILHKRRERHPGVRRALLETRRKAGPLQCDLCSAKSIFADPRLEDAIFEAHHLAPLAMATERRTRVQDMALVCSNCHRLIHRLIVQQKRWLQLEECKSLLATASVS